MNLQYFFRDSNSTPTLWLVVVVVTLSAFIANKSSKVSACQQVALAEQTSPPEYVTNSLEEYTDEQLLELLDSPVFLRRERAMGELTQRGADAIGQMARHYISSSPEAAWRIKTSLEAIGTNGDEDTFLKSVGLLQLLVGNNSAKLTEQLARLKLEWVEKQTNTAIENLRAVGAEVSNVGSARRVNITISKGNNAEIEVPKEPRRTATQLTDEQKLVRIGKIINGSLSENRRLVLGGRSPAKKELSESEKMVRALEMQLANRAINRPANFGTTSGVAVTIGKNWTGNRTQLQELNNIEMLIEIAFQQQYIDKFTLNLLSELTSLTVLEFNKCRFSGPALATVGLPNFVDVVRFRNVDIEASTIDRISKLQVRSLLFDSCDFSPSAMKKLLALQNINYLELVNQKLTSADFKRLEKLKTLSQLKLSGTRFPFPAYKELTANRPDLFVDFTTTAFLGVRSVQGLRDSCQISDVISDSGAEKGGLKVNDVIMKVDGHSIEQFNDLRANIALKKPGDSLKVTVKREGKMFDLLVKLGDYQDAPTQ